MIKRIFCFIQKSTVTASAIFITISSVVAQQEQLKIDPMLLVSLLETRNISKTLGTQFFPGWSLEKTPILFYRPGVQDVLINYPHLPKGFREFNGFSPLGTEKIYVRDKETLFATDDQNTSSQIDDIPVLVVADTFSRERNSLRDIVRRDPQYQQDWLDKWNFIQSPYVDIRFMLHEGFHVYQNTKSPKKFADERRVGDYPVLDATNNALFALEGAIMRDALLTADASERNKRIRQYVAVRHERVSHLSPDLVEYENLNEFTEGLAHYVEYRWQLAGERVKPISEIWLRNGFEGYKGILSQQFVDAVKNMKSVIAVDDDRFGNKFGAGPLRFKLYEVGAGEALMLDFVFPEWKTEIFGDGVYLGDVLERAVSMPEADRGEQLRIAKAEYGYNDLYNQKLAFEKEGNAKIQEKLNSIRNTQGTLVHIFYSDVADDIPRISFTPFGVTRIGPSAAIYDLVPIAAKIGDRTVLRVKTVNPVIIDKGNKSIMFAIPGNLDVQSTPALKLDTKEFSLIGGAAEIKLMGKELQIFLRKTNQ